ncbi:MAG: hypothetical protein BWY39_01761 [Spirochaetes bacterium ADurb.Bin269]|nr:MAG: hypothetical protein BWY39_01761 [Spirochaetes bacterium ADurb.Bin269]
MIFIIALVFGLCAAPCVAEIPEQMHTASVSVSPASLVSFAAGSDSTIELNDAWVSISLNAGSGGIEDDFGAALYPNIYNVTWERRYFGNNRYSGFFRGRYAAFEVQRLYVGEGGHPAYSTDSGAYTDPYWLAGVKLGGAAGFRLCFGSWAITPKIALTIPLQGVIGLDGFSDSETLRIYLETLSWQCLVFGIKIDFFQ